MSDSSYTIRLATSLIAHLTSWIDYEHDYDDDYEIDYEHEHEHGKKTNSDEADLLEI